MSLVQIVHSDIDHERLSLELLQLLTDQELHNYDQISLTSITGDDDWLCSVGKMKDLAYPERYYSVLNKSLAGSYLQEVIDRYPAYYRWRMMKLSAKTTYTIHSDSDGIQQNLRLHIPVISNPDCYLCFFDHRPKSGQLIEVRYEHLEPGCTYQVNTSGLHSAVNYSYQDRYHLVGVKYESSNNRTH
jgi:hypothetical protein